MPKFNDHKCIDNIHSASKHWKRVREAHESGELNQLDALGRIGYKRQRRHALADTSNVSTNVNASCQQHQVNQLIERVRELQNEIVPDFLLYQMPLACPVTSSPRASRGSITTLPYRQSISIMSTPSSSSIPNSKFSLSTRILERAHQIPERFWMDWQQKQIQERIEELEYIKDNLDSNPISTLIPNENDMECSKLDQHSNYDDIYQRNLLYLQEAQRLANERRASLSQKLIVDETTSRTSQSSSPILNELNQNSFDFDQRSQEALEAKISEPAISISSIQQSIDPSDLTTSSQSFGYRPLLMKIMLEKSVDDENNNKQLRTPVSNAIASQTTKLDTVLNSKSADHDYPTSINLLPNSKTTINHAIKFHKFQPLSPKTDKLPLSKYNVTRPSLVMYQNTILV